MNETIADLIKDKRHVAKLKQRDLSRELGYKSAQFVSNWERGISKPPLKDAKKVCEILGISVNKYKQILIRDYKQEVEEAFQ